MARKSRTQLAEPSSDAQKVISGLSSKVCKFSFTPLYYAV